MKAVIFTECGNGYGYGHFYRCMALAGAFCQRGIEVEFIISGNLPAGSDINNIKVVHWHKDPNFVSEQTSEAEFAVIDSYLADIKIYETAAGQSICIFPDDYNRLFYPDGIVVNGAVSAQYIDYPCIRNVKYLLGKEYIMLRREFMDMPEKKIKPEITNILVALGGVDNKELLKSIADVIRNILPDSYIDIITGNKSLGYGKKNIKIHTGLNSEEVVLLMSETDLAISAGGQTLNELATCGVPTLALLTAENQKENLRGWEELGFIGHISTPESFDNDIRNILNVDNRRTLSRIGQRTVDGKGADRIIAEVVRTLFLKNTVITEATEEDIYNMLHLANDPLIRANSFNTGPISIDIHKKWFNNVLNSPEVFQFVIKCGEVFTGQVRFDIKKNETVTSIGICKEFRGLGIGADILKRTLEKFELEHPGHYPITAYIKNSNKPSIKIFERAGYKYVSENNGTITMALIKD